MKVILLTDVPKVGNRYDVKDFADGYAKNVLISKGLAELATPHALAKLQAKKEQIKRKKIEEDNLFSELIASIDNKKITIYAKANDNGHLFKSINPKDIKIAIENATGIEIEESSIEAFHIKEVGTHKAKIKKGDRSGTCEIIIEAQK